MNPAYTYTLIPGGYRVFREGRAVLDQPFNPEHQGFVPYAPAEAEAAAQALIAALTAPAEPVQVAE